MKRTYQGFTKAINLPQNTLNRTS